MKNVIIINSHANTTDRKTVLINCINQFKKLNYDIILSSNFKDDMDVQKLVDYYLYDFDNYLLPKDKSPINWFADAFETIHLLRNGNSYICYKHMCTSISFANYLGYKNFIYLEYDCVISDKDLEKINLIFEDLQNKKLWMCTYKDRYLNQGLESIFFAGCVNFFVNNIKLVKNINEWNEIEPFCNNSETLEFLFVKIFENVKNEILLNEKSVSEFFDKSQIDIFRAYTPINIVYNDENNSEPLLFILTESGIYTIIINETIVLNQSYQDNNWIKFKFKIDSKDTNIKVLFNNNVKFNTLININNIENIKYKAIRYKL